MSARHTITLNATAFEELKKHGKFGETYSELIIRLVKPYQESIDRSEKQD